MVVALRQIVLAQVVALGCPVLVACQTVGADPEVVVAPVAVAMVQSCRDLPVKHGGRSVALLHPVVVAVAQDHPAVVVVTEVAAAMQMILALLDLAPVEVVAVAAAMPVAVAAAVAALVAASWVVVWVADLAVAENYLVEERRSELADRSVALVR